MNKLFNEDIYNNGKAKGMGRKNASIGNFKTIVNGRNKKLEPIDNAQKENSDEYNDFEKPDTFFVTDLQKKI